MSSDLSQLISQLRRIEHGQNPQILSVSGTTNQTMQPHHGALSSGGPNVSQTFQVANSNIHQVTYNFHLIGNSNLGSRAITNGDHGAYLNHQDSQSAVISYASRSMIEAVDHEDLNAKLAAVKESTVEVKKSTAELKGSIVRLAEITAMLSEGVTALNWPASKLGLVSEQDVTLEDITVERFMSTLKVSLLVLEFSQLSVEYGESTVRDSDSMTVGESISLVVFDTLTSKLGDVAAGFRESIARFKELFTRYTESLAHFETTESARALENSEGSQLSELMDAADFNALEEIMSEAGKSGGTVCTLIDAFSESMIAYAKSLSASDDLIAAFDTDHW